MDRAIPLKLFEDSGQPVFFSDAAGSICSCNRAAIDLLGCPAPIGLPCWEVARFRTPTGSRFCNACCPVQCAARLGRAIPIYRVRPMSSDRPGALLDLATLVIPAADRPRHAVIHLMLTPGAVAARQDQSPAVLDGTTTLHPLSRRETQILRLLARGFRVSEMAATLFISSTTVRNHVQSVLRKLGVHRRVDAILWLLRQQWASRRE